MGNTSPMARHCQAHLASLHEKIQEVAAHSDTQYLSDVVDTTLIKTISASDRTLFPGIAVIHSVTLKTEGQTPEIETVFTALDQSLMCWSITAVEHHDSGLSQILGGLTVLKTPLEKAEEVSGKSSDYEDVVR